MNLTLWVAAGMALSVLVLVSSVVNLIGKPGMRRAMAIIGLVSAISFWVNWHIFKAGAVILVDPSASVRDAALVNSEDVVPLRRLGWFGYGEPPGDSALRYTNTDGRTVTRGYHSGTSPCLIWIGVAEGC